MLRLQVQGSGLLLFGLARAVAEQDECRFRRQVQVGGVGGEHGRRSMKVRMIVKECAG